MLGGPIVDIGNIAVNAGHGNMGITGEDLAAMQAAQAEITERANARHAQSTKIALIGIGGFLGVIILVWLIYQLLKT